MGLEGRDRIVAAAILWAQAQRWTQADVPGCHNRLKRKCDATDALLAAVKMLEKEWD